MENNMSNIFTPKGIHKKRPVEKEQKKRNIFSIFQPIVSTLRFIKEHFKALLFLVIVFLLFSPSDPQSLKQTNLLRIDLNQPIMDASDVVHKLYKAKDDKNIKGVLLVVDSPGGAVAPSVEIAMAVKAVQTQKPIVTYAAGTIASGSYYSAIWSDKIIANPGSMVGSIGVILQGVNIDQLAQKIGISTQIIKAGKFKEAGTSSRQWTDEEKRELNKVLQDTYNMFVMDVATARGLDPNEHTVYADAHIFTANQAKTVGLIDELGSIYTAQQLVAKLSKVQQPVWNQEDKFDKLINQLSEQASTKLSLLFRDRLMAW
jgi:protease-4